MVEQIDRVVDSQGVGGEPGDVEMAVAAAIHVTLNLHQQAGHEVDRATKLGHLGDVHRHPDVVFGAVQTDPGHQRFASDVIRVVRLVLMPEEGQRNRVHGRNQTIGN
ncbi:MAG: hypothetical protein R3B90_11625 [Planctomycetaceae bacterium]